MAGVARRTQERAVGLAREDEWARLMIAAMAGDENAYRDLLDAVAALVRSIARRGFARAGLDTAEAEDVVQETLLAMHLKRHTWRQADPIGAWIAAIARNKLIDALRRRGRRGEVSIDDLAKEPEAEFIEPLPLADDLKRMLGGLTVQQRAIVTAISIDGRSVRETAQRLAMNEGAVRVGLHRALKRLAALFREASHEDG
jgi:RNA polymerase sigma factor (sigma-70 family)